MDVKYNRKRMAGSLGFSSNSTLHSKLLSPGVFSLENLCPDSAARMHPPRPHYLDTHPCTIPPSNMQENPGHSRTVVKLHLLLAWVPQWGRPALLPQNISMPTPTPHDKDTWRSGRSRCTSMHNSPSRAAAPDPAMQSSPSAGT